MLLEVKVDLDQQENEIAKNLLLGFTCDRCFYYNVKINNHRSCKSTVRAKKDFEIKSINSAEWRLFRSKGLDLPKENTCIYYDGDE